jgi:hypothetical protein
MMQEFQVLRVLEPALRRKHRQTLTAEVGKILFIENLVGEKRRERLHIGECRGTRTGDPMGQGGEWDFIAYLHCLMAEMPFRCKRAFIREEKCLFDDLSPFGTSCSPTFSPSNIKLNMNPCHIHLAPLLEA